MLGKRLLMVLAAGWLVGIGARVPAQEKPAKGDALAKEAVQQFFEAFKTKDVKALMKVVDVPFCREGGKHLEKLEELEQYIRKGMERRDFSKDKLRITRVTTLPQLEESEGKFTDDERAAVQRATGKDHRVVMVEWVRREEGKHQALFFIRLQDGKAKVVGTI
jgi:hypothetical protein